MVMNSRDSLAALNEMTAVQAPRPYSVSGADGKARHPGVGKYRAAGRAAKPVHRCNNHAASQTYCQKESSCQFWGNDIYV